MELQKRKKLEKKGWKIGSPSKFLGLTREEEAYIELKLALGRSIEKRRKNRRITQIQLARLLKSSQSRVAKIEKGDPSVSIDLLVKSLLTMGSSVREIAAIIAAGKP